MNVKLVWGVGYMGKGVFVVVVDDGVVYYFDLVLNFVSVLLIIMDFMYI